LYVEREIILTWYICHPVIFIPTVLLVVSTLPKYVKGATAKQEQQAASKIELKCTNASIVKISIQRDICASSHLILFRNQLN